MRAWIDGTFVVLLGLTITSYLVAERPGPSLFWVLLCLATLKAVLIQAVFMKLTAHPILWLGLLVSSVGVGVGVGLILAG